MLQAEVVRPEELTSTELAVWREMRKATQAYSSPLLSPEFAQSVGRIRPDTAIAVYRRRAAIVGFLAHHRRPGGLARPIGAPWSDYHGLVSSPGAAIDGVQALVAAGLKAFRFTNLIDPHGLFEGAPLDSGRAYLIAHDGDGDAYWERLRSASPKRFKNLRRLEHKLERDLGEITLCAPDHDPAAFEALIAWKRDQFVRTGSHDLLHPGWSRSMMQSLFEAREGGLEGLLLMMRVAGRPAAAHFGVRLGPHFHPWIAAFDPTLAAYSPGQIFMGRAIRAMGGLGLTAYDLSSGYPHYKRPYASDIVEVGAGALRAPGRQGSGRVPWALAHKAVGGSSKIVQRLHRRLDHIAAAELSLTGRIQGLAAAVTGHSRRLSHVSPADLDDA